MHDRHARSPREIAQEDADITPSLTAHQLFVTSKTIALRIHTLAEELVRVVEADRYTVSQAQASLAHGIGELVDVHRELT